MQGGRFHRDALRHSPVIELHGDTNVNDIKRSVWHFCGYDGWCYVDWADHWQTMITGILALVAAGLAAYIAKGQLEIGREQVSAARDQIRAQLEDEKDRRRRSLRAARAALPGVLTAICDHAAAAAQTLNKLWPSEALAYPEDYGGDFERAVKIIVPTFPESLKPPLQEILVHIDDNLIHERIASIFREAQVLDARTSRLATGDRVTLQWLASMILQTVALHVRASSLFEYARGESEIITDDLWDQVFVTLAIMGISNPAIKEQAKREREDGLPLGEGEKVMVPVETDNIDFTIYGPFSRGRSQ